MSGTADVAVIVAATMTGGHDGRAEAVLDVRYPNGAVHSVTLTEAAVADAVRAAGVHRLEDLRGQPWTILLPPASPTNPAHPTPATPATDTT